MIDVDSFNNKNQKAGQVSSENIGEYFNRLSNHDWYNVGMNIEIGY